MKAGFVLRTRIVIEELHNLPFNGRQQSLKTNHLDTVDVENGGRGTYQWDVLLHQLLANVGVDAGETPTGVSLLILTGTLRRGRMLRAGAAVLQRNVLLANQISLLLLGAVDELIQLLNVQVQLLQEHRKGRRRRLDEVVDGNGLQLCLVNEAAKLGHRQIGYIKIMAQRELGDQSPFNPCTFTIGVTPKLFVAFALCAQCLEHGFWHRHRLLGLALVSPRSRRLNDVDGIWRRRLLSISNLCD